MTDQTKPDFPDQLAFLARQDQPVEIGRTWWGLASLGWLHVQPYGGAYHVTYTRSRPHPFSRQGSVTIAFHKIGGARLRLFDQTGVWSEDAGGSRNQVSEPTATDVAREVIRDVHAAYIFNTSSPPEGCRYPARSTGSRLCPPFMSKW